jgi:hypothetical protein
MPDTTGPSGQGVTNIGPSNSVPIRNATRKTADPNILKGCRRAVPHLLTRSEGPHNRWGSSRHQAPHRPSTSGRPSRHGMALPSHIAIEREASFFDGYPLATIGNGHTARHTASRISARNDYDRPIDDRSNLPAARQLDRRHARHQGRPDPRNTPLGRTGLRHDEHRYVPSRGTGICKARCVTRTGARSWPSHIRHLRG